MGKGIDRPLKTDFEQRREGGGSLSHMSGKYRHGPDARVQRQSQHHVKEETRLISVSSTIKYKIYEPRKAATTISRTAAQQYSKQNSTALLSLITISLPNYFTCF